ncbi:type II toxin-antitoxin system RelE/ParE family toxin [Nesterenkonia salmonea]|uniref:Type II toxin-antitoxin system RelE/ParE family toxin n=1 Tax=Nesterenkonia salmonea TaxID=1804987 RepID=A0A5R9B9M6_9MICC|nr:type II toxin-antitoxin system RelE/ParE family toxin [Nesterenkonia salmonea]TLP95820.1 type II toxin-antitoxin system RelE/ParE family toxin [Nesterenkonia salmonea]
MSWRVELDSAAQRQLRKLDPQAARRLRDALRALASLEDPRTRGKALTGPLKGHWRYRVGDYRIICDIQDEKLVIIALDLGHRREIYDG